MPQRALPSARSPGRCLVGALALAIAAVASPPAFAVVIGDSQAGAAAAARWCSSCHLIAPDAKGPTVQGPPSFQTIARERTPEQIRAFLAHPHGKMPPIEISRTDIDDLIAYIDMQR